MREILFRGKGTHSGKWVYGDLLNRGYDYQTAIRKVGKECGEVIGIDPETIGQYTGLTDKNGKKIFEGDIVQAERIVSLEDWTGYVVFWFGCFALKGLKDGNVPAIDLFDNYKIIGNIHDNPELLKEGADND